jgi:hypothetical protein
VCAGPHRSHEIAAGLRDGGGAEVPSAGTALAGAHPELTALELVALLRPASARADRRRPGPGPDVGAVLVTEAGLLDLVVPQPLPRLLLGR